METKEQLLRVAEESRTQQLQLAEQNLSASASQESQERCAGVNVCIYKREWAGQREGNAGRQRQR